MLDYKYKLSGIKMIILNEAYTSKCSFIGNEKYVNIKLIMENESNVDDLNQNIEIR